MRVWRRLKTAVAPTGTPVFLAGLIAFLLTVLLSVYLRSR